MHELSWPAHRISSTIIFCFSLRIIFWCDIFRFLWLPAYSDAIEYFLRKACHFPRRDDYRMLSNEAGTIHLTEHSRVVKYMHEIVEEAGKGSRGGSHYDALSASIKRTYRVFRPTNHERSRRFPAGLPKIGRHAPNNLRLWSRLLGTETKTIRRSLHGITTRVETHLQRWNPVYRVREKLTLGKWAWGKAQHEFASRYSTRASAPRSIPRVRAIDLQHVVSIA